MSEFKVNTITNRDGSYGPQVCGITTFGSSGLQLPSGPTEFRGGRGRGIIAGGDNPAYLNVMESIEIATLGNATDFGDMSEAKRNLSGASSSTRGLIMGGRVDASPIYATKTIEYTVISSSGGSNDFGDLANGSGFDSAGVSSGVRGFICGGLNQENIGPMHTAMEFITIASAGDGTEFGDLTEPGRQLNAGCESPTRGIILGGYKGVGGSSDATKTIQFFTFATQGNTTKFGELTEIARNVIAVSDQTRGVRMGGYSESVNPATFVNTIDYITMASEGNATDFGDLTDTLLNGAPVQNRVRGVMMGGANLSADTNIIQFINIQSTGNATDFGDLLAVKAAVPAGLSDVHGGLAI